MREFLIKYGLARLESDHCVYIEKNLIIAIYVDDILILSKNKQSLQKIKAELKQQFEMSNLKSAEHYLKIEIHQIKKKICLIQTEYITDMLKCFDMKNCILKSIFMKKKIQLNIDIISKLLCETDKKCYQQTIESLLYLSLEIKSDISFAVVILN